jgi:hypothetical protein
MNEQAAEAALDELGIGWREGNADDVHQDDDEAGVAGMAELVDRLHSAVGCLEDIVRARAEAIAGPRVAESGEPAEEGERTAEETGRTASR